MGQSFFSKRVIKSNLKRTKSVTKLDQRKRANASSELDGALINARMRTSRSHESLLTTPSSMHSIDLTGPDVEIKPLHSSILGQDHCFQVSTSQGSKYYSCRTAEERQKWIQCLRKTIHPKQESRQRTDNSLEIWILEAKRVAPKKRYFCEIYLDKTLYAKTSTKPKGEMLFWGEQFDFGNIPSVETVTVRIYREPEKKKKKEKNHVIGYIHIPVTELCNRQLVEKWYTVSSAVVGKAGKENKGELPQLRVKAKYQSVQILPMVIYMDLLYYLQKEYTTLVEILEPQISVKAKEDIAVAMVHIMQKIGKAKDFLSNIVMMDVDKLDNDNLTFRGNSIATKAMEAYLKLVGDRYLKDTLGDFIRTILESLEDCEVDPARVPNNAVLQRHQTNLTMYCEMVWFKIINSHCFFPKELARVFSSVKARCAERKRRDDISANLMSSCLFLRFLCPAILSPSLFHLTQEFPQESGARTLTLIAKVIQTLANFAKFGTKEDFMTFMNDFVEREMESMKEFLERISSCEDGKLNLEFDGYIDLGKELSILHSLLVESLEKINMGSDDALKPLKTILCDITEALKNPQEAMARPRTWRSFSVQSCDNVATLEQGPIMIDPNANTANDVLTDFMKDFVEPEVCEPSSAHSIATHAVTIPQLHRHHSQDSQQSLEFKPRDGVGFRSVPNELSRLDVSVTASGVCQRRPDERRVNQTWNKIVNAAEAAHGDYVDLINLMDEQPSSVQNSSAELDNGSISQVSTIASSGYQSIGYSQSNSPVDVHSHHEAVSHHHHHHQPLSFSNPLFKHCNNSQTQTDTFPESESCGNTSGSASSDAEQSSQTARFSSHSSQKRNSRHRKVPFHIAQSSSSCESLNTSLSEQSRHAYRQKRNGRPVHKIMKSTSLVENSDCNSANFSLATHEFSKSADFTRASSTPNVNHGLKRTATDTILLHGLSPTSPEHPIIPGTYPKSGAPQSTVRMGVRSVQIRKVDADKTKQDYEEELSILRQELAATQAMLQETQERLNVGQDTSAGSEWKLKYLEAEERRKREKQEKEEQLKDIIQRLRSMEDDFRKEHVELKTIVSQKQKTIETQEKRIQSLESANSRLLSALTQVKDRCQANQSHNGVNNPSRSRLQLPDGGIFKSSSC